MTSSRLTSILVLLLILVPVFYVIALPTGPVITHISNTTRASTNGSIVNGTTSDPVNPRKAGGYIYTITLSASQQNPRWKAYVGNVTGTLVLDDADGYTIYDWPITTSLSGEVYATRSSGSVNWTGINCSYGNSTLWEERQLNHTTNPNDNISQTFNQTDHNEFFVGDVRINASLCPSINVYVNDSQMANVDTFEEVLLYDGTRNLNISEDTDFTNVVYTAIIEQDEYGYKNISYDFQMLLPEVALEDWVSATAYYFYVELT